MSVLLAVLVAASVHAAPEKVRTTTQTMQEAYDQAFKLYRMGDYRKAMAKWSDILRTDPSQSSAQRMIDQARQALAEQMKLKRAKVYEHAAAGRFKQALLQTQALIDLDPTDTVTRKLEGRLEQVSKIVPEAPQDAGKAWRVALLGIKGFLLMPQDLKLAHNGLRYASELQPGSADFGALLALVRTEYPPLVTDDDVTPGMKLMEHKHLVALHHIYDARYHAAIPVLQEILQLEPNDLVALKRLGTAFFSLGRKPQAKEAWQRALRLAPKDQVLQEYLAKVQ
ncbi:MAG: tetratricopeptide repeat protein [Elusimicrobia bacterium]|nr:tetratricopeptide repeat protein [Elusimicrobiota bacterium]